MPSLLTNSAHHQPNIATFGLLPNILLSVKIYQNSNAVISINFDFPYCFSSLNQQNSKTVKSLDERGVTVEKYCGKCAKSIDFRVRLPTPGTPSSTNTLLPYGDSIPTRSMVCAAGTIPTRDTSLTFRA